MSPSPTSAAASPTFELTTRELRVLQGMAQGKSNGTIGRELYIAEDTIKSHARRLFRKLGAHDRAHAVHLGWQLQVLNAELTDPPSSVADAKPSTRSQTSAERDAAAAAAAQNSPDIATAVPARPGPRSPHTPIPVVQLSPTVADASRLARARHPQATGAAFGFAVERDLEALRRLAGNA